MRFNIIKWYPSSYPQTSLFYTNLGSNTDLTNSMPITIPQHLYENDTALITKCVRPRQCAGEGIDSRNDLWVVLEGLDKLES
jgi:hypothetical protein